MSIASQLFQQLFIPEHALPTPFTPSTHARTTLMAGTFDPNKNPESRRSIVKLLPFAFYLSLPAKTRTLAARPPALHIEKQCVVSLTSVVKATDDSSVRRLTDSR